MPRLKSAARTECEAKATRLVEDPFEPGAMIRVEVRAPDPLHRMLARREIDQAQAKAGAMLRDAHERVGASSVRAIDLSTERVDGGRRRDGLPERVLLAARRLRQAQTLLGWQNYRVLICCIVEGCPATAVAQQSSAGADRGVVAFQVRNGLEQLAVLWGLAQDPKRMRRRASMVATVTEKPGWIHDERELAIQYA